MRMFHVDSRKLLGLSTPAPKLLSTSEELQEEIEDGLYFCSLLFRFLTECLDIFDDLVSFSTHFLRDIFQIIEDAHEVYGENNEANREKHDSDSGDKEENVCVNKGVHGVSIARNRALIQEWLKKR